MDSSVLVNAIRSAFFGDSAEPRDFGEVSAGAVAAVARRWAEGRVSTEIMAARALSLRERLDQSLSYMRADLEASREVDAALLEYALAVQSATSSLQRAVRRLHEHARDNHVEYSSADADAVEVARDALLERQVALQEWLAAGVSTCARCGHRAEHDDWCAKCEQPMIVPAPPIDEDGVEAVPMGPALTAVYFACEAVASGAAPFDVLAEALRHAEGELAGVVAQMIACQHQLADDDVAHALQHALAGMLDGLAGIRRFETTRVVRDLNEGWAQIAHHARALHVEMRPESADVVEFLG
ncbi:MAG: hypothetical protein FJX76_24330 [Armatimonadetes bacterium]|nr:hypothetical protein [Armatimonadota bacterium]